MKIEIIPVQMSLASRDLCVTRIEKQIEAKKRMLLEKQKVLNKNSQLNMLLNEINKDYQDYYNYIIKQKEEQMKALQILNQYIEELARSGNLSKHNVTDAKTEQKNILREIHIIQKKMESLIYQVS